MTNSTNNPKVDIIIYRDGNLDRIHYAKLYLKYAARDLRHYFRHVTHVFAEIGSDIAESYNNQYNPPVVK